MKLMEERGIGGVGYKIDRDCFVAPLLAMTRGEKGDGVDKQ
jgi:hypothetical protein